MIWDILYFDYTLNNIWIWPLSSPPPFIHSVYAIFPQYPSWFLHILSLVHILVQTHSGIDLSALYVLNYWCLFLSWKDLLDIVVSWLAHLNFTISRCFIFVRSLSLPFPLEKPVVFLCKKSRPPVNWWLAVPLEGAYTGLTPVRGTESLTPHYYLRQPLTCGCLFCLLTLITRKRVHIFFHTYLVCGIIFF